MNNNDIVKKIINYCKEEIKRCHEHNLKHGIDHIREGKIKAFEEVLENLKEVKK
ncbi:MAG: hypothetical protein KAX49_07145 [Halanaerobiales bacterium]|nr:hypothetical protein [Halanaerobiales bacterium]